MPNPNEKQIGGAHYASSYQHWDYVRQALQNRYLEGCASKYIARYKKKNGLQDLEKAKHYLEKILVEHREHRYNPPDIWWGELADTCEELTEAEAFCEAQGFPPGFAEHRLLTGLAVWQTEYQLLALTGPLNLLLAQARL